MFKLKMDFYNFIDKISVLNYIGWLFVLNLLFWVTTLPCLFILLFLDFNLGSLGFLFLSTLLIGPSLGSVLYSLLGLQADDEKIVKNYFYFYRRNFLKLFRYCAPFILLLWIAALNLLLTTMGNQPEFLKVGNLLMACILVTYFINFVLVSVKYETSFKQTLKICFHLMMVKSLRFNGNFMILLSTYLLFSYAPIYLLLYGVSVFCFLMVKNSQPVWK